MKKLWSKQRRGVW